MFAHLRQRFHAGRAGIFSALPVAGILIYDSDYVATWRARRHLETPYATPARSKWMRRNQHVDLRLMDPQPKLLLGSFGCGKTSMLQDTLQGKPAHFVELRDGCENGTDFQQRVFSAMGFRRSKVRELMVRWLFNSDMANRQVVRSNIERALAQCSSPPTIVIDDAWRLVEDADSSTNVPGFIDGLTKDTFYWLQTLAFKKQLIQLVFVSDHNSIALTLNDDPRAGQNIRTLHMFGHMNSTMIPWMVASAGISATDATTILLSLGGHFEQTLEVLAQIRTGVPVAEALNKMVVRHYRELEDKLESAPSKVKPGIVKLRKCLSDVGFARRGEHDLNAIRYMMKHNLVIETPSDPATKKPAPPRMRQVQKIEKKKRPGICGGRERLRRPCTVLKNGRRPSITTSF